MQIEIIAYRSCLVAFPRLMWIWMEFNQETWNATFTWDIMGYLQLGTQDIAL